MINWNGKRRWVALILLIAGIVVMLTVPPIIPVIQLPGEVYPGSWMTNTLMASIVVWILIGLLIFYVRRKMPKSGDEVPPGGFYNLFEMLYDGLYGFIRNIVGETHMRYIWSFFFTIFLIVLLSNWLELIPGVDTVGFLHAHVHTDETGHIEYEDGYELSGSGIYFLNPKCPFVPPAEAALLTAQEQAGRIVNGCVTGTGAAVAEPVIHEVEADHGEEAVVTENADAAAEGNEAAAVVEDAEHAADAPEEVTADAEHVGETTTEDVAAPETEEAHAEVHFSPGDSVPWHIVPFLRAPSTDLNMTLALALIALVAIQILGFRALGPSYLTKFFNFKTLFTSPLGAIDVAVGLLELIGEFAKILSFSFRLLGNIFAGAILLFVMSFLIPFLPWPFFLLEFGVGALQAFVFGLLTAIFMSQATAGHGGEHHDEHAADGEHAAEAAPAH